MWQKRSEMVRKQYVSAIKGALIFLLIAILAAALLPTISLARPASTESLLQPMIHATPDPTANLPSVADAQVRDWVGYGDTNYGTSTGMYVGYDLDTGTFRSFVRFDLSSIPSGSTINSASFNAYVDGVSGSPTIDVYRVLSSWGEHNITWNNQPDVEEVPTVSRVVSYDDEGEWISWDVTELVRAWLAGTPNHGLSLWGPTGGWARFNTRETAYTPYLLVNYTGPPITPPVDNTPPEVSISYSPERPTPEDQVTFTAVASDLGGSGIARIEIWLLAFPPSQTFTKVAECPTSPCWFTVGPYPEGTVIDYYAKAWDREGNEGWTGVEHLAIGGMRDTTPPEVSIFYSPKYPTILDEVTFIAVASDPESGIARIEMYMTVPPCTVATKVAECSSSPCIYTGRPYPEGTVTCSAGAANGAGGWIMTSEPFTVSDATLPTHFDWRNWQSQNWLTPAKQQGCGDCWAFAAVGTMEAKYNIEQDALLNIDLSEQYLVSDCYAGGNCNGRGATTQARIHTLDYIKNDGISDEVCFPYIGRNCPCTRCPDWSTRLWKIDCHGTVGDTIDAKKRALLCHGPLMTCGGGHCVILIGWDDADNSWIVKNSWTWWQNGGFGKIDFNDPWSDDVFYVQGVVWRR